VERHWTIKAGEAGSRLDAFLRAQLPFVSGRELDKALAQGCFMTNGRPTRKGARLAEGDVVKFSGPPAKLSRGPIPNEQLRVPLIYEDQHLLAFNKPAGMDCHGFSGDDQATLANFVVARRPEIIGVGKSRWQPGLVHRIDRDTSGLVLVAKDQRTFEDLADQFRHRVVRKRYLALVQGSAPEHGQIALALAHDPSDRRKMRGVTVPRRHGTRIKAWPALTSYQKLGDKGGVSFLQLEMSTGVTHQLRAHLAFIGHPIVGDLLYGASTQECFGLKRHFLHASQLSFTHPVSSAEMSLQAPLPRELKAVLARLKLN
jgi:23S rRNA pseudouridine1911/1915/1917 synthase